MTTHLLVTTAPMTMPDGVTPCGANVVWNRILWDGVTPYTPPPGTVLTADDGTQIGAVTLAAAVVTKAIAA